MKTRSLIFTILILVSFSVLPVHAQDSTGLDRGARAEIRFLEGMIDHHQMALDMAQDCLNKASADSLKELCQNVIDAQSIEIATMQGMLRTWYQIDYAPMSMNQMNGTGGMMDMMSMMCGMMAGGNNMMGSQAAMPDMQGTAMPGMGDMTPQAGMGDMPGNMSGMGDMTAMPGMGDMTPQAGMSGMSQDMMGMMSMMCNMMMSGGMMGGNNMQGGMMGGNNAQGGMMNNGQSAGDSQGMMGMMAGLNTLEGQAYDIAWIEAMIDHHDDAVHMSERILPRAEHDELSALAQKIIDDQTAEIQSMEDMLVLYQSSGG